MIISQLNEEKQRQIQVESLRKQSSCIDFSSNINHTIEKLLSINDNLDSQEELLIDETELHFKEHYVMIDLQFIVESVILALIDLDGDFL